jgi:hypothetical protein
MLRDLEWTEPMKKALRRLWTMYDETSSENIRKTIWLKVETQLLAREKEDVEKKYTTAS